MYVGKKLQQYKNIFFYMYMNPIHEIIKKIYKTNKWILPDILKNKTIVEVNELFMNTLIELLTDNEIIDIKKYNEMVIELKIQFYG